MTRGRGPLQAEAARAEANGPRRVARAHDDEAAAHPLPEHGAPDADPPSRRLPRRPRALTPSAEGTLAERGVEARGRSVEDDPFDEQSQVVRRSIPDARIPDTRIPDARVADARVAGQRAAAERAADEADGPLAAVARAMASSPELLAGGGRARKLQVLGMLASSVAHDFGNLIQGVSACLDLALSDSATREKRRQYILEARGALRHGADLARQLTSFSRRDGAGARPIAVDAVVADMAAVLRRILGESIALDLDTGAPDSAVLAHPGQLEQILLNLGANGRDAMPAGGALCIRTRRELGATPRVRLEVCDSGSGMDAATREHIFEPFFTTKPLDKGTGLGLSIVRAVASALRGEIEVVSECGRGTAFVLRFPECASERRSP